MGERWNKNSVDFIVHRVVFVRSNCADFLTIFIVVIVVLEGGFSWTFTTFCWTFIPLFTKRWPVLPDFRDLADEEAAALVLSDECLIDFMTTGSWGGRLQVVQLNVTDNKIFACLIGVWYGWMFWLPCFLCRKISSKEMAFVMEEQLKMSKV